MRTRLMLLTLLLTTTGTALHADEAFHEETLHQAVEDFLYHQALALGDEIQITVHSSSAHFAACPQPAPFIPRSQTVKPGRISVGVRCADANNSLRYINAELAITGTWLTPVSAIPAGTIITADMLEPVRGDLGSLPASVVLNKADIVGQVAARQLNAGSPLRQQDVRTLQLVKRGEEVLLESGGSGFRVSRRAEAMEPGGLGDTIRVRLDRRNILLATVAGNGRVVLN